VILLLRSRLLVTATPSEGVLLVILLLKRLLKRLLAATLVAPGFLRLLLIPQPEARLLQDLRGTKFVVAATRRSSDRSSW